MSEYFERCSRIRDHYEFSFSYSGPEPPANFLGDGLPRRECPICGSELIRGGDLRVR